MDNRTYTSPDLTSSSDSSLDCEEAQAELVFSNFDLPANLMEGFPKRATIHSNPNRAQENFDFLMESDMSETRSEKAYSEGISHKKFETVLNDGSSR